MKLHLGCGHIIKEGWVNHDIVPLAGVDVVHDLMEEGLTHPHKAGGHSAARPDTAGFNHANCGLAKRLFRARTA